MVFYSKLVLKAKTIAPALEKDYNANITALNNFTDQLFRKGILLYVSTNQAYGDLQLDSWEGFS